MNDAGAAWKLFFIDFFLEVERQKEEDGSRLFWDETRERKMKEREVDSRGT